MTKFSTQEKIEAVKSYINERKGQKEIAQLIGVDHSIFCNCIKQYEFHGEVVFKNAIHFTLTSIKWTKPARGSINPTGGDSVPKPLEFIRF